jgi:protein TonB
VLIGRRRQRLLRTSAGGERLGRVTGLSLAAHGLAAALLLLAGRMALPLLPEPATIEVVFGRGADEPGAAISGSGQSAPASAAPTPADSPLVSAGRQAAGDGPREAAGGLTAAATSPGDAPPQPRGGVDPRLEFEDADPTLVAAQADTGNRTPPYPDEAYQYNEEGTVVLRLHIASDGRVERVEIKQSSGSPWLDEAAQKTLGTWRFLPARRDGQPVRTYRDQPVHFLLQ